MSTASSNSRLAVVLAACALVAGCVLDSSTKVQCTRDADCLSGRVCVASLCQDGAIDGGPVPGGEVGGFDLATSADVRDDGAAADASGARDPGVDRATGDAVIDTAPSVDAGGDRALDGVAGAGDAPLDVARGEGGSTDGGDELASPDGRADGGAIEARRDAATEHENDAATDTTLSTTGPPNYAFVTSTGIMPQFPSLAVPDAHCQTSARNAGLRGTFKAWISDGREDAPSRLGAARGWVRPDGLPIADTVDDLVAGHILYPLGLDETGRLQNGSSGNNLPVTATTPFGLYDAELSCADWTASINILATSGFPNAAGTVWFSGNKVRCDELQSVLCFGVDKAVPVSVPTPPKGRLAFLSSSKWSLRTGIAAADAVCQGEAAAAHFAGTFKALLETTTSTLEQRLSLSATDVLLRPDGVRLNLAADWLTSGRLEAAWNVTTAGDFVLERSVVFGGGGFQDLTFADENCHDWSSATGTASGSDLMLPDSFRYGPDNFDCAGGARVYCLRDPPAR